MSLDVAAAPPLTEPERRWRSLLPAMAAVEMYTPESDAGRHQGRNTVRQTMLRMSPVDGQPQAVPKALSGNGVFWGLLARNGVTLALRVADFAGVPAAERDAYLVLGDVANLVPREVEDLGTGRRSLWLTLDDRVLLVAAHVWRSGHDPLSSALMRLLWPGRRSRQSLPA
jgi:hypothetical protein